MSFRKNYIFREGDPWPANYESEKDKVEVISLWTLKIFNECFIAVCSVIF